jgi:flagellar basal-body rod protein FlgG
MERGLYIAASGMLAEQARQDALANDLANASTPGYKADRVTQKTFSDVLLHNTATGASIGNIGTGVQADRMVTDLRPGPVRDTGEPNDFAVVGDGFFAVQTAGGTRYTRNGQFRLGAGGVLEDGQGNKVLGQNGQPLTANAQGRVDAARIGVFTLANATKQGDNLFTGAAGGKATGTIRQGALEGSGADPTRAMVDMIASLRAFESGQKAIQTIDETLGKAANQVANLTGG